MLLIVLYFTGSPMTSHVQESWLSTIELTCIYKASCSRRNFAANLARRMFDEETRKISNVSGKRGKSRLNPIVMEYIKSTVFQFYPISSLIDVPKEWSLCVTAIDETSRRLVNRPKKS